MAEGAAGRAQLYAAVGPELTHYEVDVAGAALSRRATVTLPANIHYCWPHASRRHLYCATSDSASGVGGFVGARHNVSAFAIASSGELTPYGQPVPLPTRPIHMTTDIPSEHALVAFSNPSGLRVYRINPDATLGAEIAQPETIDPGIYGHQVRVSLDNRTAILVTRGHDATTAKPEDPGALKVFRYDNGLLTGEVSVAPNGGYGFGPRHLDFHPTKPWVYVSLERQNRLDMFSLEGGRLSPEAVFRVGTLAEPGNIRGRQAVGTVKVHPSGRFVYVANRASSTTERGGRRVFVGGENTLAVFALDPATGEPKPIQQVDTRGIHCRNFHIDPSGRLLVASHIMGLAVKDGDAVRDVPACLSVFRIGDDGKLDYVRKYDIDVGDRQMFWMGMV
ncbi:MAG TPA: beta-propeller fold lactonase family protein [Stellaceae bacterium]|jgi:6-phosphogluconolactonase (cycloisomerase 2 family)|nr:beta-propeller fold lactonase family protein [Stellaceae bacterium]